MPVHVWRKVIYSPLPFFLLYFSSVLEGNPLSGWGRRKREKKEEEEEEKRGVEDRGEGKWEEGVLGTAETPGSVGAG